MTEPENEHDPYLCQFPKISTVTAFRSQDKCPSKPHPLSHQKPHAYTLPEKPNGISVPLHYDFYVFIRSHSDFTPQAEGNSTLKELNYYLDPNI